MSSSSSDVARPRIRWQRLVWPAAAGFLFGYAVLHPVSMVIYQWLDPRLAADLAHDHGGGLWGPVAHSFHLSMLPMGLVFGTIGAVIAALYGFHRLVLTAQRDRLAQQAEMLRQSNEALARLELANRRASQFMAHDFKTALGCVAGFAAQLLQQPRLREDSDAGPALVSIRRQAHRMLGSVSDLLELARVREDHGPRMKPVSVAELLQEAVSDFSLPAHTRRITLGDRYHDCPRVFADPRLLRRVLCNLVSNAIRHNGPDTQVRLDARVTGAGTEVLFSCCDDGAGIPPEMLPSIFTEFTGTNDSTGLGLAFCREVVEAHGGRIWCESEPDEGAQFFLTIPLPKESDHDR